MRCQIALYQAGQYGKADGTLYAAVGCDWSMGAGGKTQLFRYIPGGESFETVPLPAGVNEHYPICGAAAGAEGTLVLSVETSAENNWPDLYYSADRGERWQPLALPWEDAQLDDVGFLYRVSWLRQQEDGSWQLCLTQEPTGVKGYDWCALFTARAPEGPWTYAGKQPDPASR